MSRPGGRVAGVDDSVSLVLFFGVCRWCFVLLLSLCCCLVGLFVVFVVVVVVVVVVVLALDCVHLIKVLVSCALSIITNLTSSLVFFSSCSCSFCFGLVCFTIISPPSQNNQQDPRHGLTTK